MPNRILRDWTDSETIDTLTIYAERFFTRLIMKVDDYGRYSANLKLLKSTLFPLKTDVRETDISLWLTECKQCGLIALYNIAQKDYLQIDNFKQALRQKNEKYPPPITCVSSATHPLRICEHEKKRNETKRNEEEEEGKKEISPHTLGKSNLFRQPVIPEIEQVYSAVKESGGTKEMADNFFNKFNAVGWYYKGSPITNFKNLLPSFISNWQKFEIKNKSDYQQQYSAPPLRNANDLNN